MNDANSSDTSRQDDAVPNGYDFTVDPETDSVSVSLLMNVAGLDERDLTELPALAESIDPDALDDLFAPRADGTVRQSDCTLAFTYAGYEVRVETDGSITLIPTEPSSSE